MARTVKDHTAHIALRNIAENIKILNREKALRENGKENYNLIMYGFGSTSSIADAVLTNVLAEDDFAVPIKRIHVIGNDDISKTKEDLSKLDSTLKWVKGQAESASGIKVIPGSKRELEEIVADSTRDSKTGTIFLLTADKAITQTADRFLPYKSNLEIIKEIIPAFKKPRDNFHAHIVTNLPEIMGYTLLMNSKLDSSQITGESNVDKLRADAKIREIAFQRFGDIGDPKEFRTTAFCVGHHNRPWAVLNEVYVKINGVYQLFPLSPQEQEAIRDYVSTQAGNQVQLQRKANIHTAPTRIESATAIHEVTKNLINGPEKLINISGLVDGVFTQVPSFLENGNAGYNKELMDGLTATDKEMLKQRNKEMISFYDQLKPDFKQLKLTQAIRVQSIEPELSNPDVLLGISNSQAIATRQTTSTQRKSAETLEKKLYANVPTPTEKSIQTPIRQDKVESIPPVIKKEEKDGGKTIETTPKNSFYASKEFKLTTGIIAGVGLIGILAYNAITKQLTQQTKPATTQSQLETKPTTTQNNIESATTQTLERISIDESQTYVEISPDELSNLAEKKLSEGKLSEAKKIYNKILEKNKNDPFAWSGLGEVAFKEKDYETAFHAYAYATHLKPEPIYALKTCILAIKTDMAGKALDFCNQAVELDPTSPEAHRSLNLAKSKYDKTKSEQSKSRYTEIKEEPSEPEPRYTEITEGINGIENFLEKNPDTFKNLSFCAENNKPLEQCLGGVQYEGEQFTPKDIEYFVNKDMMKYDRAEYHQSGYEFSENMGLFVTLLIKYLPANSSITLKPSIPLDYLGYKIRTGHKKISVQGNVGTNVGYNANDIEIIVTGTAGANVGIYTNNGANIKILKK